AGADPVQQIDHVWTDAVGGKFKLTFKASTVSSEKTSAALDYTADATAVENAINAAGFLPSGQSVTVTDGTGTPDDPWIVTFQAAGPVGALGAKSNGDDPLQHGIATVARTIPGVAAVREVRKLW